MLGMDFQSTLLGGAGLGVWGFRSGFGFRV